MTCWLREDDTVLRSEATYSTPPSRPSYSAMITSAKYIGPAGSRQTDDRVACYKISYAATAIPVDILCLLVPPYLWYCGTSHAEIHPVLYQVQWYPGHYQGSRYSTPGSLLQGTRILHVLPLVFLLFAAALLTVGNGLLCPLPEVHEVHLHPAFRTGGAFFGTSIWN